MTENFLGLIQILGRVAEYYVLNNKERTVFARKRKN